MGDENPIRTLGDYSKPSHEGYRNTIELPEGNNVLPLRPDTIRLVQNGCSFYGFRPEDPNQHLKDFLKLVDSLDLDVANRERTRMRLFQSLHGRILVLIFLLNSFQKEWDNPPNIIFEQELVNLKAQAKRLHGNEKVWVEMHKGIAWDKVIFDEKKLGSS
ncbi:hypothetical protein Tco_0805049 [Tanacetum coccineum]